MLHLFDKPDQGPSINEVLEKAERDNLLPPKPRLIDTATGVIDHSKVWAMETVYHSESGDDAKHFQLYASKEAAIHSWFSDNMEMALEPGYFEDTRDGQLVLTPSQWLAETLEQYRQLREDGFLDEGDQFTRLTEMEVLR
jgi:hypothetical protein